MERNFVSKRKCCARDGTTNRLHRFPVRKPVLVDTRKKMRIIRQSPFDMPVRSGLEGIAWYPPFRVIFVKVRDLLDVLVEISKVVPPGSRGLSVDSRDSSKVDQNGLLSSSRTDDDTVSLHTSQIALVLVYSFFALFDQIFTGFHKHIKVLFLEFPFLDLFTLSNLVTC